MLENGYQLNLNKSLNRNSEKTIRKRVQRAHVHLHRYCSSYFSTLKTIFFRNMVLVTASAVAFQEGCRKKFCRIPRFLKRFRVAASFKFCSVILRLHFQLIVSEEWKQETKTYRGSHQYIFRNIGALTILAKYLKYGFEIVYS